MGTPAPTIPPLPPPPPSKSVVKEVVEKELPLPDDEVARACSWKQESIGFKKSSHCDLHCYCWFIPTKPLLQQGPVCGLVALAIAAEAMLKTSLKVENLLEEAKIQGWTSQGEMFSARNLASLAEISLPCIATVQPFSSVEILLQHIAQGNIALVPYDADFNHEPSLRQGHSAHWAVVSGFCLLTDVPLPLAASTDPTRPQLHYIRNFQSALNCLDFVSIQDAMVFTRHGKSCKLGLWSASSLLHSNRNLSEVADKHKDSTFVIPEGGMDQNLAGQIVFLTTKT